MGEGCRTKVVDIFVDAAVGVEVDVVALAFGGGSNCWLRRWDNLLAAVVLFADYSKARNIPVNLGCWNASVSFLLAFF
jgi:hypothetical protein